MDAPRTAAGWTASVWTSVAGDHERYGAEPSSALVALRLQPRALSVGGTTGSGVLRGRPGQRFTTGAAAAAAGGVAETDGSAGAAGS